MNIAGIPWTGLRGANFDQMIRFFAETLGLELAHRNDRLQAASFRLPAGQIIEILGPANPHYDHHEHPVIGFQVDDIRSARAELEASGVEFSTEIESWRGELWSYFRGPEGHLYELVQRSGLNWRETLGHTLALASALENEGMYNLAKQLRAAADSMVRREAYSLEQPEDHGLQAALERVLVALREHQVEPDLLAALERGMAARAEGRLPLFNEAPDPSVCRNCGQILLQFEARCPTCGAWPIAYRPFQPMYWLDALEPFAALERLRQNPADVAVLLGMLPEEHLARQPEPSEWSIRQIVAHLRDAQDVLHERLIQMIEHDRPTLPSLAVFAWADAESASSQTTRAIFQTYRESRRETIAALESLPMKDWWRTGDHQEFGIITIRQHVSYFAAHEISHFSQIEALRNRWISQS